MNEIFNMYFGIIEDERDPINTVHPLVDILKLIMTAMLCGMDELDKVVDYEESKKEFLEREFNIKLIPSRSTFNKSNGNDKSKVAIIKYNLYIKIFMPK